MRTIGLIEPVKKSKESEDNDQKEKADEDTPKRKSKEA